MRKAVSAVTCSALLALGAGAGVIPAPAAAAERPVATADSLSDANLAQAFREFASTDLPRESASINGETTTTFHLRTGLSLTMTHPVDTGDHGVSNDARLGAGKTKNGYWISFNQFDQNTLSNAFAAAALTTAICVIPGVGVAACAVAGVIVSVGVSYIHKSGVCSKNRELYVYDVKGGSVVECRASAPK